MWQYGEFYNTLQKEHPEFPDLSEMYRLYYEAGKSVYGADWTPEDYGANAVENFDRQNMNTWPPALREAYDKWRQREERGATLEDLADFFESDLCPPGLKESDEEGDEDSDGDGGIGSEGDGDSDGD